MDGRVSLTSACFSVALSLLSVAKSSFAMAASRLEAPSAVWNIV